MMFPKKRPTPPARRQLEEAMKEAKKRGREVSGKRGHKYNAEKALCQWAKHPHPSKLEAAVCDMLHLREAGGDIRNLKWQATVHLGFGVKWKVDFKFEQSPDWHERWAEAKGKEDRDFKLKFRMWKEGCGPGPLEMWRGEWRRPYLERVYWPAGGDER